MTRRMYLPPPVAYEGDDACRLCSGRKVTGMQLAMPVKGETIETIIVDVLCPACQGCGRGPKHISCDPDEHADWTPLDGLDDETTRGQGCASCGGRQWNAVLGFSEQGKITYHMRVPCGCAESLMVEAS